VAAAAEVEGFAVGAEDCGDECAVAGVDAGFGGGDRAQIAEHGPPEAGLGALASSGKQQHEAPISHAPAKPYLETKEP